jgi:cadmium resistance protein CadD (predicted permease)
LDGNSFLKNILFLLLLIFYVELRRKLCQNPKIKQPLNLFWEKTAASVLVIFGWKLF